MNKIHLVAVMVSMMLLLTIIPSGAAGDGVEPYDSAPEDAPPQPPTKQSQDSEWSPISPPRNCEPIGSHKVCLTHEDAWVILAKDHMVVGADWYIGELPFGEKSVCFHVQHKTECYSQ